MTEHYFSRNPTSRRPAKAVFFDGVLIQTASGVFSRDHIDRGTQLLLKHATLPERGRILDLGCGVGVVGLHIKRHHPHLEVVLTDVNQRAIATARKNAKENGLDVEVREHDGVVGLGAFDAILLNPPQHAGKKLCLRLIEQAAEALVEGGVFFLVARTQKGGKSLAKHMAAVLGDVVRAGGGSGFSVYKSVKA